MSTRQCPHCNSTVSYADQPVRYCPFCGGSLAQTAQDGPSALERRVQAEKKPARKYALIQAALAEDPDDFAANRALLFHGRLHEKPTHGRTVDFANIKCHLLTIFDTPSLFDDAALQAKYEELLRGPQLQRTMALAPDADAFFQAYIEALAYQYIDLFIRGSSRISTYAFGLPRSAASMARAASEPVRRMLANIRGAARLTEAERALLSRAVREGFARVFPGYTGLLEA